MVAGRARARSSIRRRSAPARVRSITAEDAMLAYMTKNKDWCQIPDDAINQLKETHAKSVAFGGKACTVAAQMEKMKKQAAQAAQQGGIGGAAGASSRCRPVRFEAARGGSAGRAAGEPGAAARAGFRAALRATRALGPPDRLAAAARAVLVGDGARRRRRASRARISGISRCSSSARSRCAGRAAPTTTFSTATSTPASSARAAGRCPRAG